MPRTVGGYLIEALVGGGGMAQVYRAHPPADFRDAIGRDRVAIKTLLPAYAHEPLFREMFAEEAEICCSLQHPNVVELIDFGEDAGGALFLVMEWIDGLDFGMILRSFRRRNLRLHPVAACAIVEQALRGLHAAHTRVDRDGVVHAVVHRDVSPANLLVSHRGEVKIGDFGLARPLDRVRRTLPGVVKGKFAYLAPEQAFDRAVDPRTDVFAAGIVLWEALASRHLFRRDDDLSTVLTVRQAKVPDIRKYAPGLDPRVASAVEGALRADPDKRHPSALAFADQLAAFLADQPMKVGPELVAAVVSDVIFAERGTAPELALPRLDARSSVPRRSGSKTKPPPLPTSGGEPTLLAKRSRRGRVKNTA
ncbi:MAG: serine/threonine-protein kinase [Polyangiales bacterium]